MTTVQVPVPHLDDLVRLAGEGVGAQVRLGQRLVERHHVDPADMPEFRELSTALGGLRQRATRSRMVPIVMMVETLHRAVRDLARQLGKQVDWTAGGTETELDRGVLDALVDPLLHLVRNAVDHGIEAPHERVAAGKPAHGRVQLHVRQAGPDIVITIRDDGRGIDVRRVRQAAGLPLGAPGASDEEALQLIFRSGVSTARNVTDVSGRGVGLDVVRTNIEAVRGRIEVATQPAEFTEFRVRVPITLAVRRCLLMSCAGQRYAVGLQAVVTVLPPDEPVVMCEGYHTIRLGERLVALTGLAGALRGQASDEQGPVVVLDGATRHAFRVDELLGQRDVVVKGLSPLLPRLSCYTGVSAEADGSLLLVLDSAGLIEQARQRWTPAPAPLAVPPGSQSLSAPDAAAADRGTGTILVVDDALTVRELQRAILERAGFQVLTAADGIEALTVAESTTVDLVLTDVAMPRMDGLELTRALREHPRLRGVGILMLTALGTDEDRRRGLEAGADGYIVKSRFDEQALLAAVHGLMGEPR